MLLALLFACSLMEEDTDRPDKKPVKPSPSPGLVAPILDRVFKRKRSARSGPLERIEVKGKGIGFDRSAYVKVPMGGDGPYPVIMAFHGGKGNDGRKMVERLAGAEDRGILLVYPNGSETRRGTGWVGPDKDDEPADAFRDVRYTEALIDTLDDLYDIDTDRVYAVGMSGGGYMTDLLWCSAADRFAGFGVVARAMPKLMSTKCRPKKPTPFVLVVGTADDGLVNDEQLSLDRTRDFIHDALSCDKRPDVQRMIPAKKDDLPVDHTRWDCARKSTFDYYLVHGGGHQWPGSGKKASDKCMDLDATGAMLDAFGLDG